jgi:prepilin peptidase CpaA
VLPQAIRYLLLALIAIAAVSDIRSRRISNWLTFGGMLVGLGTNAALLGLGGLRTSALGLLVGFGVYFALYLFRAIGAGDVKLMGAVGALVGPSNWWSVFLIASIAGGLFALIAIAVRGRFRHTLWNIGFAFNEVLHLRAPFLASEEMDVGSSRAMRLPHAVPIAVASLVLLAQQGFWV